MYEVNVLDNICIPRGSYLVMDKAYVDFTRLWKLSKDNMKYKVTITNNFKISSFTVVALYRYRWGIETFFKWIKQHLKILSFWVQSENAVKTQVWIAISTYVAG